MDGQRVKQWEARCIEEQPPACVAGCPLRVDARTMLEKVKAGDFAAACAIFARAAPLPAVLSRICDHPCENACRRAEAGGAIRIGALERACIEAAYPTIRRAPQTSRKPKRVAVVGAGLAGLTAAFDLAMKGSAVIVFEAAARPLPRVASDYQESLPRSAIDADVAALRKLGVDIRCGERVDALALSALIAGYDAVLIAIGAASAREFGADLALTAVGFVAIDAESRVGSQPKVFGGGVHGAPGAAYSPIASAYDGRRAAASIDRFLQGASLTASRANEASAASCLYVNVAAHAPAPAVAPAEPDRGYISDEAIAEAKRCFPCHCLECVKACEYLKHYGAYPKRYVREIYNNLSIVLGNRKSNRMIDGCTLCGLCGALCPNDLSMGEVCLEARRDMVESGHMPASHHDFALRDMAHSRSEAAAFARAAPGQTTCRVAFFPGCQLAASSPWHVESVYINLAARIPGLGIFVDCCGAPADWSGRRALREEIHASLRETWRRLGEPTIVTACSSCLKAFGDFLPELEARSLWTVLTEIGFPDGARAAGRGPYALHDPCTGRRAVEAQRAVRGLAAGLGVEVGELSGAELTTCCGFGGLASFANPEIADRIVDRRIGESERDYLTYCAMCRDNFARRGKRAVHLLDLVFRVARRRRSGRAPGSRLLATARQPRPPQSADAQGNLEGRLERARAGLRVDCVRGRARRHGAQADSDRRRRARGGRSRAQQGAGSSTRRQGRGSPR